MSLLLAALLKHEITVSHTCDQFRKRIREVFFSFQGGFSKMYRIYRKIANPFQGDFLIL